MAVGVCGPTSSKLNLGFLQENSDLVMMRSKKTYYVHEETRNELIWL
jgi:hypothetical protein